MIANESRGNVSIAKAINAAQVLKDYCDNTDYELKCRDCLMNQLCISNFAGWTKQKFAEIEARGEEKMTEQLKTKLEEVIGKGGYEGYIGKIDGADIEVGINKEILQIYWESNIDFKITI